MYNKIELNGIEVLVKLPTNYSDKNSYPVFVGISGGDQTAETVAYSAKVYFSSSYFQDHIQIIPINTNLKNFKDYSVQEIEAFIKAIMNLYPSTTSNWTIAGTSNGGKATFNFVAQNPKLFKNVVTFPGGLFDTIPNESWSHLNIVLANGKKDGYSWILESKASYEKLLDKVNKIELMVVSGQKHIFSEDYQIDQIYSKLFEDNNI